MIYIYLDTLHFIILFILCQVLSKITSISSYSTMLTLELPSILSLIQANIAPALSKWPATTGTDRPTSMMFGKPKIFISPSSYHPISSSSIITSRPISMTLLKTGRMWTGKGLIKEWISNFLEKFIKTRIVLLQTDVINFSIKWMNREIHIGLFRKGSSENLCKKLWNFIFLWFTNYHKDNGYLRWCFQMNSSMENKTWWVLLEREGFHQRRDPLWANGPLIGY